MRRSKALEVFVGEDVANQPIRGYGMYCYGARCFWRWEKRLDILHGTFMTRRTRTAWVTHFWECKDIHGQGEPDSPRRDILYVKPILSFKQVGSHVWQVVFPCGLTKDHM